MNKTLNEIVSSIIEDVYGYHVTDDSELIPEIVKPKVLAINAKLVQEHFESGKDLTPLAQKICCIELECEKPSCVIDGVTVPTGDVIWKAELPALHPKLGDRAILYLGASDMQTNFNKVSLSAFLANGKLEWSRSTKYTTVGNIAYFKEITETGTARLCLLGVLANPTEACNWQDDTTIFPCPDVYKLELLVKKDIFASFPGISHDNASNATDELGSMRPVKQPQQPTE